MDANKFTPIAICPLTFYWGSFHLCGHLKEDLFGFKYILLHLNFQAHKGLNMRKPVFGVSGQVGLKAARYAKLISFSYKINILNISCLAIIIHRLQMPKVLIRLHRCIGWSSPLLFAYI